MTLNEIREAVNIRLNKDVSGQSLTKDQFNVLLNIISLEYFKFNFGLPERYTKEAPYPPVQWEVSQLITDDMNPFLIVMDGRDRAFLQVNAKGFATLPSDYFHLSSIGYDYMIGQVTNRRVVEVMTNAEWNPRLGSHILAPTKKNPVCRFLSGKLEFYPRDLTTVSLSYLRRPATPVYAVTEESAGETEVYDSVNSVQLEWPDYCHPDLVNMMVSYAADNLKDGFIKQASEMRKKQGV